MQLQPQDLEAKQLLCDAAIDGARHASNVLIRWLGRYVRIDTDGFAMMPLVAFSASLPQAQGPHAVVRMAVTGDLSGQVLLSLPLESSEYVAASLLGMSDLPDLCQDELARSSVQETANIVASAYLGSLGTWLGLTATPSAPEMTIGLSAALMDLMQEQQAIAADTVLVARTDFHLDDVSIAWGFYMLPSLQSMQAIASRNRGA